MSFFKLLQLVMVLNLLQQFTSWPTLKLKIFKYIYDIIEPTYMDFNITEQKSGGHIMYVHIKKENLKLWISVVIHFENDKNEYKIEFMNKTFNVCKMLENRRYQPIMSLMYDGLHKKMPTLPKRCPIKKDVYVVSFDNFETDKMPPVWPESGTRFTVTLFTYENGFLKPIETHTVYMRMERK